VSESGSDIPDNKTNIFFMLKENSGDLLFVESNSENGLR